MGTNNYITNDQMQWASYWQTEGLRYIVLIVTDTDFTDVNNLIITIFIPQNGMSNGDEY